MTNTPVGNSQHPVEQGALSRELPPQQLLMPSSPEAPKQTKGLAVTALVLGIAAMLTAVVPGLGALLGIASIVCAGHALKRRQAKGISIVGLVLGILATITSLVVTFLLVLAGSLFGAATQYIENAEEMTSGEEQVDFAQQPDGIEVGAGVEGDTDSGSFERIPWDSLDVADAPASTGSGTVEDPHTVGTRFSVDGTWEVVVNSVDRDAEEHYLALMSSGVPAPDGKRYVLLNVTVKNLSDEPKGLQTLSMKLDIPGKIVSERRPGAESPEPQ